MQNVPVGKSSSSGCAGYVSHTGLGHRIPPATSLGQQPGDNAYFSSVVVDPAVAFPFNIDPVNRTLTGYPTAMAPPPAINNFHPSQLALPLDAYQLGVEIPGQFFLDRPPMAPLDFEAAGPPALTYGAYGVDSPERFVNKSRFSIQKLSL